MTDSYEIPDEAPIVCTIRPGADEQAMMEVYRGLFGAGFLGGERTEWGVRWRFREDGDVEARVRRQADAEAGCCPFLRMSVTVVDATVVWDVVGPANASAFLDEYVQLPRTVFGSVEVLRERTIASGMTFDDRRQSSRFDGFGALVKDGGAELGG
ncbi:hypothetical protein [Nocardia sp. NPDC050710]|uniref:hypothetical protein n=1 Tax=Nocardia sp. NPDC050710 TaxID=3157220 RepID=UPI00340B96A4